MYCVPKPLTIWWAFSSGCTPMEWKASAQSMTIMSSSSSSAARACIETASWTMSMILGRTMRSWRRTWALTLDLNMSMMRRNLIDPSSLTLEIAAILDTTT